jgi:hypothetical protein
LQEHNIGQGSHLEVPNFIYRELHLNRDKALQTVENILASADDLGEIANQLDS